MLLYCNLISFFALRECCCVYRPLLVISADTIVEVSSWRRAICCQLTYNAKNTLHTFPRDFPIDGEVAKLSATIRCNGIWETTRHNRHNDFCLRQLVADLL